MCAGAVLLKDELANAWFPSSRNVRNVRNVRTAAAVLRSYVKNNVLPYVPLSSARAVYVKSVAIESNPIATDLTYTSGQ